MSYIGLYEGEPGRRPEIWFYIAKDDPGAADKFIHLLVSYFPTIASMPDMGRQRKELETRLRSVPIGNYVVFYCPIQSGVEIVRVLHGARDFPPLFE